MRVLFNGGGKRTTQEEDQVRCYLFCSYFQAGVLIVRASRGSLVVVEFDWLNGNRLWGVVKPIVKIPSFLKLQKFNTFFANAK